jgi:AcrR family transcriptional regulator
LYSDDVAPAAKPSRSYRSTLREQQAERTRELIAHAARDLFLERGWTGTSVRSVADAAGVSEATVYAVYGTKAGLALSLIDSADTAADAARGHAELEGAQGDPVAQLRALVGFDRRLFEQAGSVLRVIVEGRAQHPELATAYDDGRRRGERIRRDVFGAWPKKVWRSRVDVDRAVDVYQIVCSFPAWEVATAERGWTPDQVERWWGDTLVELLLR